MLEKAFLLRGLEKVQVLGAVYTLVVAVCGWVIFDLDSLSAAFAYYGAMFGGGAGAANATDWCYLKSYAVVLAVAVLACLPLGANFYNRLPARARAALAPVLIALSLVLSTAYLVDATYNPFLYFRF